MPASQDQLYRSHSRALSAFNRPRGKPRPLYPVLVILLLSALLWAMMLAPIIWLLEF